jgi:hypothetical protein
VEHHQRESMTTAQHRRDDEVQPYISHLLYEIQQLGDMPALVARFDAHGPATLKIACLESCLVHARLIIEFLMGRPKKNAPGRNRDRHDIRPSLFLGDWHAADETIFDVFLDRLDKHLVHLSKDRGTISVDDGSWALSEVPRILHELNRFAQALTAAGSRHGPVIETLCEIGLSRQPGSPGVITTASTSAPSEVTIISSYGGPLGK